MAFNPLIGVRGGDMATAAKALLKAVVVSPRKAGANYALYLKELGRVVRGNSQLAAEPKDRRFSDPAWQGNVLYKRLLQAFLLTQKELGQFIDQSELTSKDKGRAHFFASLVTDALAPSNWVLGNPSAVRKIVDTGGDNLVKGLKNLVHDLRYNHMLPSQVDTTPFKVGVNVATSVGQVVLRHEMFELLQFTPSTSTVMQRPLVMSPPQVNKYYAMDLSPDKSLVKWACDSGVQLFVVSWRNPTLEQRHWGLTDYVKALDIAVNATCEITGSPDVNMWGSCSGGMTLAAYLGWLAARGEHKVANTSWAVCVLNTEAAIEDSTLGLFSSPEALRAAKARSRRRGIVTGEEMASMFAWLRPNDLIWNYWVNNYLLGNSPPAYDILAWNADTTRLPGQYHCDLIEMMEKNPYVNPGALEIDGLAIDFSQVRVNAYVVAGLTDHITPWRACYGTARLFGPNSIFILANAGHLQSMINPPGIPKSYFFEGTANTEDPVTWAAQAQASRKEGSWWPHWREWIQGKSGDWIEAPKKLGSRKHKPLGAAPGTYVLEK
ncbi:alpha/beta fold hydrolase [Roseateles koreensis]|uniref:Alpha/beta fold hydrolase n=1 Tax=Roseateles koreensis TaxID=2987526 RepID=A0ABT5KLL0_9BURK|nr:alpha/beta fold hydrolase [Roseateles koreensis]MDC8783791.1 alpha/beta fold hydrolase [Roseateles koreensis]